jgi:sporulation protein YlmC with PRC-barrel domain
MTNKVKVFEVKILIKPDEIRGKKVITYKGMLMGKVDTIEVDEKNWQIKEVDVLLEKEMEKLFDVKLGRNPVVPVPVSLLGPIEGESITLKEEIKDPKALLEQAHKR